MNEILEIPIKHRKVDNKLIIFKMMPLNDFDVANAVNGRYSHHFHRSSEPIFGHGHTIQALHG